MTCKRLWSRLYSLAFYWFQFKPDLSIYTLVSFSPAHARCGTVAGEGNQNQMGPGVGPLAEAAVGPSRSWLPRKKGYIGVGQLTTAQPVTL